MYYVFAEDFCSALVGPFNTQAEAQDHITFCTNRGDGAKMEVVTEFVAKRLDPDMRMSAEEDRDFEVAL